MAHSRSFSAPSELPVNFPFIYKPVGIANFLPRGRVRFTERVLEDMVGADLLPPALAVLKDE